MLVPGSISRETRRKSDSVLRSPKLFLTIKHGDSSFGDGSELIRDGDSEQFLPQSVSVTLVSLLFFAIVLSPLFQLRLSVPIYANLCHGFHVCCATFPGLPFLGAVMCVHSVLSGKSGDP